MSVLEYNDCTYGEIVCIMAGYRKRVFHQSRESWEQARHIAFYSVAPHVQKGSVSTPQNLIPMPWDIEKARFKDKDEESDAKQLVIDKVKSRVDGRRRKEIAELKKQTDKKIKKDGKPG